ncbi:MAG TPA: peptide chain release factor 1 [Anaerolineaceae bacterium]|nr:peptide chain release factor 1 [Anaerolineaceae bacterium]HQJ03364.1 peptide chain release factor 1 [Anaerolineaceae bacterium]
MLEKLAIIEARFNELNQLMEENMGDYTRVVELAKERAELDEIVHLTQEYQLVLQQLEEARQLQDSDDEDLRMLAISELDELTKRSAILENQLKLLLVPKDPRDDRNIIVEIRAGTGGDEAGLFVADLFRMYVRYAERHNWHTDVLSANETGIGGFKEMIFSVKGRGAYSRLKFESGVHRVQRIPATESSGRIHTSTVTVAVLAEVEEVDLHIPESDLEIDVYRSAGAGGQNVQKNSTAIRITHKPSGIVVACQDERSQLQNKLRAMSILRARLYEIEVEKRRAEMDESRRSQVGTGERAEKIRTYNYPQNRVTDHRVNISSFNLPAVMDGELDQFIDELSQRDETERLSSIGEGDEDE